MGLDAYICVERSTKEEEDEELSYFRKFNALENYMSDIWYTRGNTEEFNCEKLYLDEDEWIHLQSIVQGSINSGVPILKPSSGFFFGSTEVDDYYWICCKTLVKSINKVLAECAKGNNCYYTSWW